MRLLNPLYSSTLPVSVSYMYLLEHALPSVVHYSACIFIQPLFVTGLALCHAKYQRKAQYTLEVSIVSQELLLVIIENHSTH